MILLTGASGFVGQAILKSAQQRGLKIRPAYRSLDYVKLHDDAILVSELNNATDWSVALKGVDVLIHTAARTHIMSEKVRDPVAEFRRVNVEGTLNLAQQAAVAGVRRFVFISSIKVNGEATAPGTPFAADDAPDPKDAYGTSKAEAETELREIARKSRMEVTIIRPPLIYGPGVKGNFASLIRWLRLGLPLPLGGLTHNRRSFVGLDNLVDLILVCCYHPNAANQIFLISDGQDLSTTALIKKIGKAMDQEIYLLWVPVALISFIAKVTGKKVISQRLLGWLQVDIHKTCELLDWKPLMSLDEGLRSAVE